MYVCLSVCQCAFVCISASVCLGLCVWLALCVSISWSLSVFVCVCVHLCVYVCMWVCLSLYLPPLLVFWSRRCLLSLSLNFLVTYMRMPLWNRWLMIQIFIALDPCYVCGQYSLSIFQYSRNGCCWVKSRHMPGMLGSLQQMTRVRDLRGAWSNSCICIMNCWF